MSSDTLVITNNSFVPGETITIEIFGSNGLVSDSQGAMWDGSLNSVNGSDNIYSFVIDLPPDNVAPYLTNLYPVDTSIGMPLSQNIVLTFDSTITLNQTANSIIEVKKYWQSTDNRYL